MTKTTLQNTTKGTIVLNESQAGILRKICEVKPDGSYVVRSQLNQTYKEYLCVSENSNQFTLSSDDLCEWKEILIKTNASDAAKLVWVGKLGRNKSSDDAGDAHGKKSGDAAPGTPAQTSILSKLGNRVGRMVSLIPKF